MTDLRASISLNRGQLLLSSLLDPVHSIPIHIVTEVGVEVLADIGYSTPNSQH